MTLADQAMGMTALRATGNKPHATIELNILFVGAVRLNEFVEAHCEIVRLTRAIIFMQCKLAVGARVVARWQRSWNGNYALYAVVIEGRVVHDPWRSSKV
jgi:acyl-coenzyme A thioesterase PaaI-like protein